jgi:hypothetical protein
LKYLGFYLEPNDYGKRDWQWLIATVQKRLFVCYNHWLSRGGRLILVKSILEAIPIYWMSLVFVPKDILEKTKQLSYRFLWSGSREKKGIALAKRWAMALPKDMGGWGLKNIHSFSKALEAKCVWHLIGGKGFWCQVITQEYIFS